MKTNYVPSIIMLLAGFISCIISIEENLNLMDFTVRLLLVLVIFYIIGSIIKVILDKAFKALKSNEVVEVIEEATDDQPEMENISTDEDNE